VFFINYPLNNIIFEKGNIIPMQRGFLIVSLLFLTGLGAGCIGEDTIGVLKEATNTLLIEEEPIGDIGEAKNVVLKDKDTGEHRPPIYTAEYTWKGTTYKAYSIKKTEQSIAPIALPFEDATAWIKENTPEDSVVLSWWDYGHYIRLFGSRETVISDICESETCLKTYAGDKSKVFRFEPTEKVEDIAKFFTSDEEEAFKIAQKYGVDYVMVTYEEFGKSGPINNISKDELFISSKDIPSTGNPAQDEQAITDFLAQAPITSYHVVNFGNYYRIWYLVDNGQPEMKDKMLPKLLPFNTGHGQGLEHFELVYSKYGYVWIYKVQ
jgi:hydroxylamine oxidation protein HaoB